MWVLLGVVIFLALLVGGLLLLPVYLIVRTDEKKGLQLQFRILGKTLDGADGQEKPKKPTQRPAAKPQTAPQNSVADMLKKAIGLHRFEKAYLQRKIQEGGFFYAVSESVDIIRSLLEQVAEVIRGCVAVKFQLKLRCATGDPADTAIVYSRYCALVYPLVGYLSTVMHLQERGADVNISCNMLENKTEFFCHVVIRLRIFYVVRCFLRILSAEAKRKKEEM